LLIAVLASALTAWGWHTALQHGYYHRATAVGPPFFIVGVALILFPGYREERIARGEDITNLEGMELITPRWWGVTVLALICAGGNILLLTIALIR